MSFVKRSAQDYSTPVAMVRCAELLRARWQQVAAAIDARMTLE
jgi:hypothetical protein